MRAVLILTVALCLTTGALAQGDPGGGSGGGPPGGRGGPPDGARNGPAAQRMMKPIKREKFDKVVTAMFQAADTNRDGIVTIEEHRARINARKDRLLRDRFAKIDSNRNASIDLEEFLNWQNQMGSLAFSENASVANGAPVPEVIMPDLGDDMDDQLLARLIEPLGALTIVNANSNYDSGMTLAELIDHQGKRFDAVDADKDGAVSMEEARHLGEGSGKEHPRPSSRPPDRPSAPAGDLPDRKEPGAGRF